MVFHKGFRWITVLMPLFRHLEEWNNASMLIITSSAMPVSSICSIQHVCYCSYVRTLMSTALGYNAILTPAWSNGRIRIKCISNTAGGRADPRDSIIVGSHWSADGWNRYLWEIALLFFLVAKKLQARARILIRVIVTYASCYFLGISTFLVKDYCLS